MDKHILEGDWHIAKGWLKQTWAKLTDDDLKAIEGNHEELYGRLQKHYGYSKDKVKEELKRFDDKNWHH
ncbi:MAG: CsbD family protein [Legionella sp.]|nr:CsbD family protein [Legionella sp.]